MKMGKLALIALGLSTLTSASAFAQGGITEGRTETDGSRSYGNGPFIEPVRVGPGIGAMNYNQPSGSRDNVMIYGVDAAVKVADWKFADGTQGYLGIATGARTGQIQNSTNPTDSNRFYIMPARIEVGGTPFDRRLYLGLNGGADLTVMQNGTAIATGRADQGFEPFPAAGGRVGWAVSDDLGVMAAGDYTIFPAEDAYSGLFTVQLGVL